MSATHREAVAAVALAEERVTRSEVAWQEARRRTTSLEHLAERHREFSQAEETRLEQLALDEHTSAVAGRRHDDSATPGNRWDTP